VTEVRPLRSAGITPLHRCNGPLRLPAAAAFWVMDSPEALPRATGSRWDARAFPLTPFSSHATTWGHSAPPFAALLTQRHHTGSPKSLVSLSIRALVYPGQFDGCFCSFPSPPIAGFTISGRLATSTSVTRPIRVRCCWAHIIAVLGGSHPFALAFWAQYRAASLLRLPPEEARSYVLNEHLTRLTPFSQIGRPDCAWHTRFRRF
jgi:hypothetical protein